ncbi:unnamed protein product [Lathyrus sativus]|nr:unnamed protein product [Lathyrus sativus]
MGFLKDDMEYIGAIKDASQWGSGHFLRQLVVIMLLSGIINRAAHVWSKTWNFLVNGILYKQRHVAENSDLQLTDANLQNLTLIEI